MCDIRRKFFFATEEAKHYDETIEMVVPRYKDLHELMLRLGEESIRTREAEGAPIILDIGSGTGAEAIPFLKRNPLVRVVGVDLCSEMHDIFVKNARSAGVGPDRYELLTGDILDPAIEAKILQTLTSRFDARSASTIISAFTVHHFDRAQRADVFRLTHSLVESGGVFLLGDLFNYAEESGWLTSHIFSREVNWITDNFRDRIEKARKRKEWKTVQRYEDLRESWVSHYNTDNQLDSMSVQMRQLQEVGFTERGNPFRYWQVGLLWARK